MQNKLTESVHIVDGATPGIFDTFAQKSTAS